MDLNFLMKNRSPLRQSSPCLLHNWAAAHYFTLRYRILFFLVKFVIEFMRRKTQPYTKKTQPYTDFFKKKKNQITSNFSWPRYMGRPHKGNKSPPVEWLVYRPNQSMQFVAKRVGFTLPSMLYFLPRPMLMM